MSKEGRKFETITGLDLPEEKGEAPDGQDIEHGSLILKLKNEETIVFDILSTKKTTKVFLIEFFMEFAQNLYKSLKEEHEEENEGTPNPED